MVSVDSAALRGGHERANILAVAAVLITGDVHAQVDEAARLGFTRTVFEPALIESHDETCYAFLEAMRAIFRSTESFEDITSERHGIKGYESLRF
jgi:hypothetical protein